MWNEWLILNWLCLMKFHVRLGTYNENIAWESYMSKVGRRSCFVSAALQAQLSSGSYNTGLVLWHQIFSGGGFPRFATEKLLTYGNCFLMLTGVCHFTKWVYPLRATFTIINKYICICFDIFLLQNNSTNDFFVTRGQKLTKGLLSEFELRLVCLWDHFGEL